MFRSASPFGWPVANDSFGRIRGRMFPSDYGIFFSIFSFFLYHQYTLSSRASEGSEGSRASGSSFSLLLSTLAPYCLLLLLTVFSLRFSALLLNTLAQYCLAQY